MLQYSDTCCVLRRTPAAGSERESGLSQQPAARKVVCWEVICYAEA